jgi:hypothetical protein
MDCKRIVVAAFLFALLFWASSAFAQPKPVGQGVQFTPVASDPFTGTNTGIWVKSGDHQGYFRDNTGTSYILGPVTLDAAYINASTGPQSVFEDTTRLGVLFDARGHIAMQPPAVLPAGANMSSLSDLSFGAVDSSIPDAVGDNFTIWFGVDGAGHIIGNLTASRAQTFQLRGDVDTIWQSDSVNIEGGEFIVHGGNGSAGYRAGGVQLIGGVHGAGFTGGDGGVILDTGGTNTSGVTPFGRADIDIGAHLKTLWIGNLTNTTGQEAVYQGGTVTHDFIDQFRIRLNGGAQMATFGNDGSIALTSGSTSNVTVSGGTGASGGVYLDEANAHRFSANGSGAVNLTSASNASVTLFGGSLGVTITVPSSDISGNPIELDDGSRVVFSSNYSAGGLTRVAGQLAVRMNIDDGAEFELNHYSGIRYWNGSTALFTVYAGSGDLNVGTSQTDSGYLFTVEGTSYLQNYIQMTEIAAPGNAASGTDRLYIDSTTHKINFKDSSGVVHVVTST